VTTPLVRPRFLKGSVVAFVLLLPFVFLEGWDYMETRRLATSIAKMREHHEPVITQDIQPFVIPHGESADASRYYRAASTLVGMEWDEEQRTRLRARVTDAIWSDVWPDDLVADLRARVAREEEAMGLMDRAAPLAFEGFGSGFFARFGLGDIMTLMRVAPLRTRLQALDGHGNAAASSLFAELRLQRVGDSGPYFNGLTTSGLTDTLRLVVNRSHPDAEALSRIASSLREMDRDDRIKNYLLRSRASIMDTGNYQGIELLNAGRLQSMAGSAALMRPLLMARLNDRVDTLSALIDNAAKPWPERMEPPRSAYFSDSPTWGSSRLIDADVMASVATDLALIRCARVVVAVEQYRLAHRNALPSRIEDMASAHLDAIPIDPFSGKPMRFVAEDHGYVVYSFGRNLRDEGGQLPTKSAFPRPTPGAPTPANDLGIRITHR
jgi:hypothetical protein